MLLLEIMSPEIKDNNHFWRNTALASTLAITALHGGIEAYTDHGHGPRVEIGDMIPWAPEEIKILDGGTEVVGAPYRDKVKVADVVPGESTEELKEERSLTGATYARRFDKDPRAGELEPQPIADLVTLVQSLQIEGWNVNIHVQGLASAEDDATDASAGLQTPSEDNQNLANFRRNTFVEALTAEGIDPSMIVQEPGLEDTFSDSQMETLEVLAKQFGYESALTLVDAYNMTPDRVPPSVSDTLSQWLDTKRGVTAVVKATREVAGQSEETSTEKEVCFIPVIKVIQEEKTTGSWKITVPYAVVAPFAGMLLVTVAGMVTMVQDIRQFSRQRSVRSGGVDKSGGSRITGDGGSEGSASVPSTDSCVSKPSVELTPPGGTDPEKKKRRKWPWLIPPIIIAGAFAVRACHDEGVSTPPPRLTAEDICRDLKPTPKIVGTRTIITKNGYRVSESTTKTN